jgi:hypothetical protein
MTATKHIAEYDIVELTEPVEAAPAGSRGGVLDIFSDGMAMVEITSLPAEMDIDRLIVAPLGKLRVIEPAHRD